MQQLRKNVALAIDGGGIRGTMVAKALAVVEESEKIAFSQRARLFAGTSTGSIISAALGAGLPAARIHQLYVDLAGDIFPKTWRSRLWPLTRYRYSNQPLIDRLREVLGDAKMGDLWPGSGNRDLIIVLRDLVQNRNLFVKSWKEAYQNWPIWKAVVASSTVPTYFPVFEGRYIDGGVGSYSNPCYVAAFEIAFLLEDWKPEETTLISIGTGHTKTGLKKGEASRFHLVKWVGPILDGFTVDAARQQVNLVHYGFDELDFRRFNIELTDSISMDDTSGIAKLTEYGEKLGHKILNDDWDEMPESLKPIVLGDSAALVST
jgi:patatin-like phospholipase/acyl hydrolase